MFYKNKIEQMLSNLFIDCCRLDDKKLAELIITAVLS